MFNIYASLNPELLRVELHPAAHSTHSSSMGTWAAWPWSLKGLGSRSLRVTQEPESCWASGYLIFTVWTRQFDCSSRQLLTSVLFNPMSWLMEGLSRRIPHHWNSLQLQRRQQEHSFICLLTVEHWKRFQTLFGSFEVLNCWTVEKNLTSKMKAAGSAEQAFDPPRSPVTPAHLWPWLLSSSATVCSFFVPWFSLCSLSFLLCAETCL